MLISIIGFTILFIALFAAIILGATGLAIVCVEIAKYMEKNYFDD